MSKSWEIFFLYLANLLFTNWVVYISEGSNYGYQALISIITLLCVSLGIIIYKKTQSSKLQLMLAILLGGFGVFLYVFITFMGIANTDPTDSLLIELAKAVYFGVIGMLIMTIFWLPCSLVNYFWIKNIYSQNSIQE